LYQNNNIQAAQNTNYNQVNNNNPNLVKAASLKDEERDVVFAEQGMLQGEKNVMSNPTFLAEYFIITLGKIILLYLRRIL
jgi:hypothetical protein